MTDSTDLTEFTNIATASHDGSTAEHGGTRPGALNSRRAATKEPLFLEFVVRPLS